jgi:hypothetical protein
MKLQDEIQLGKDRYIGSRLREHDEKLDDLYDRVEQLAGSERVEVSEELAGFVRELRREVGISDEALVTAIFDRFGLGAFSDRQIAAALESAPQPQSEGDEQSDYG